MIDISDGIKLFNDCDFFSAHDFFEDIWLDADKQEKDFFQGMIQISVGCYHLICGNIKGAESQLCKGKNKLERFLPDFYKIDVSSLIIKIDLLLDKINHNFGYREVIPIIELIN